MRRLGEWGRWEIYFCRSRGCAFQAYPGLISIAPSGRLVGHELGVDITFYIHAWGTGGHRFFYTLPMAGLPTVVGKEFVAMAGLPTVVGKEFVAMAGLPAVVGKEFVAMVGLPAVVGKLSIG